MIPSNLSIPSIFPEILQASTLSPKIEKIITIVGLATAAFALSYKIYSRYQNKAKVTQETPKPTLRIQEPYSRLVEWTFDRAFIQKAVMNALVLTDKKFDGLPGVMNLVVDYLEVRDGVFGEKEWAEFFGTVSYVPSLPPNFEEKWQGPCPIHLGKRLKDTHTLIYIPKLVNGVPLTLKILAECAKRYFSTRDTIYREASPSSESSEISVRCRAKRFSPLDYLGDLPVHRSYWGLILNEQISKDDVRMSWEAMTAELLAKRNVKYVVPRILEVSVAALGEFAKSRRCLFQDTYIRCQDVVPPDTLMVAHAGHFSREGLCLTISNYENHCSENGLFESL